MDQFNAFYNILVIKKTNYNFFTLVGIVTISDLLTYISLNPIKLFLFISNYRTRTAHIPKDEEFQAKQKCHLWFFQEFNSFRVIVKKNTLKWRCFSECLIFFSFLNIAQGPQIYQKMQNFKQINNVVNDFFWEFNSFRVIVRKTF